MENRPPRKSVPVTHWPEKRHGCLRITESLRRFLPDAGDGSEQTPEGMRYREEEWIPILSRRVERAIIAAQEQLTNDPRFIEQVRRLQGEPHDAGTPERDARIAMLCYEWGIEGTESWMKRIMGTGETLRPEPPMVSTEVRRDGQLPFYPWRIIVRFREDPISGERCNVGATLHITPWVSAREMEKAAIAMRKFMGAAPAQRHRPSLSVSETRWLERAFQQASQACISRTEICRNILEKFNRSFPQHERTIALNTVQHAYQRWFLKRGGRIKKYVTDGRDPRISSI